MKTSSQGRFHLNIDKTKLNIKHIGPAPFELCCRWWAHQRVIPHCRKSPCRRALTGETQEKQSLSVLFTSLSPHLCACSRVKIFLFLLQVLLYDLRSSCPLLVKDHLYNLPITSLNFQSQLDLVLSSDSKIIKIWNKDTVSQSLNFRALRTLADPFILLCFRQTLN